MRRQTATLFTTVCLLSGSLWLLPAGTPGALSDLTILAGGAVIAAFAVTGHCILSRRNLPRVQDWNWKLVLGGVGSLGAPALLLLYGRQHFSSVMAVATQTGVPMVVAIAFGAVDERGETQEGLIPGALALGGALLLLPVALPASVRGWAGLGLYLLSTSLTGICSVLCHREMIRLPSRASVLIVTSGNAIFLCAVGTVWLMLTHGWPSLKELGAPDLLLAALTSVDVACVACLLYLLHPLASSVRFVFAPLLAALEACVLLRPTISPRAGVGMLLMVIGGFACLRSDHLVDEPVTMSLH